MKASRVIEQKAIAGRIGSREVAAYRRDQAIFLLENVCTHRQCQTAWNADEQTWDCPCHGSRFTAEGEVINGPAREPLRCLQFKIENDELELVD